MTVRISRVLLLSAVVALSACASKGEPAAPVEREPSRPAPQVEHLRQFRQVGAKFLEIHVYLISLRGCFCFGKFYRFFLLIISPEMISIQAQINNTAASHRGSR